MKRRGQASLEYLTTYGWAFILIIVMIGALAYFGVLNPKKLLPDRCTIGSEFQCTNFKIGLNEVRMKLKNNFGEPIKIGDKTKGTGVNFEGSDLGCTLTDPGVWGAGETKDIVFTGCNVVGVGITAGSKEKVNVKLIYYSAKDTASLYPHTAEGEVLATVQAATP